MIILLNRSGRDYTVWASTPHGVAGMEVIASKGKNLMDVILC